MRGFISSLLEYAFEEVAQEFDNDANEYMTLGHKTEADKFNRHADRIRASLHSSRLEEALRATNRVVDAARAYRAAECDGTSRMWRGKALQDLANTLDEAFAKLDELRCGGAVRDG